MPQRYTHELTAKEKRAIRKLVTSGCANYDNEYGCLPLDGACYMFTIAFAGSSLCKWFQSAVLPLDPALEAVFTGKATKSCQRCGRKFPVNGRQAYCSDACAEARRKAATAKRVRKHRTRHSTDVTV